MMPYQFRALMLYDAIPGKELKDNSVGYVQYLIECSIVLGMCY